MKEHRLVDIVTITRCAVICGADDWVNVATFGRAKEGWLRTFLALPGGIPSHDTFGRVFARLDPDELRRCFLTWVTAVVGAPGHQVVAVDGTTLRGSHDRRRGQSALNLLRQDTSSRSSIATKRFRAALDDPYLCSILTRLST